MIVFAVHIVVWISALERRNRTAGGTFCQRNAESPGAKFEKTNSHHVMHDFEPYFCTEEKCRSPLDVPNTFEGLLGLLLVFLFFCWFVVFVVGVVLVFFFFLVF